jgi:hypothetical protein
VADQIHRVTAAQLRKGLTLSTGQRHIIRLVTYELRLRLPINPNEARTVDDRFTLKGGHPQSPTYSQTKTTRDDLIPGDDCTDLLFTSLEPDVDYSLEIDPGQEGAKYFAFEGLPWSQIEPIASSPGRSRT